jgi:hypothetical protein
LLFREAGRLESVEHFLHNVADCGPFPNLPRRNLRIESLPMLLDQVEKLKSELTDKYVVVDGSRPELRRFAGTTGQVKTVNMSGRALVEFDQFNNIGWYDIHPAFLKVVDKPAPKPAEEKPRKAAPKAEAAPAAAKPAAASAAPAAAKKPSTADILAAARAKSAAPAAAPAEAAAPKAPAEKPKLSTADILAAARGKAAAPAAAPAPKPAPPAAVEPPPVEAVAAPAPPPPVEVPVAAPPAAAKAPAGKLPTATPDILAWCRAHDTKG